MATSDERREVAARLREESACGEGISCCSVDKALGLRYDDDYFGDVFECESVRDFADLIDPTCHCERDYDRDERELVEGRWWKCDGCGEHFAYERGFEPSFCPNCGARVVSK